MGLLDFGQSKQLPERERVAFAALIAELARGRRGPGAARPDQVRRCGRRHVLGSLLRARGRIDVPWNSRCTDRQQQWH